MEITKEQKIEALERLVKAIFGRQETEIKYKKNFKDIIEITLECDVDDAIKQISNLSIADIDYWFYTNSRDLDNKHAKLFNEKHEGYTEINLIFETQYWKKVEELENELRQLKSKKFK